MSISSFSLISNTTMSRNDEPKVTTSGIIGFSLLRRVKLNNQDNQCSLCELNFCCVSLKALSTSGNLKRCRPLDCYAANLNDLERTDASVKTSSLAHFILCSQMDVDYKVAEQFGLDCSLFWLSCQICSCK